MMGTRERGCHRQGRRFLSAAPASQTGRLENDLITRRGNPLREPELQPWNKKHNSGTAKGKRVYADKGKNRQRQTYSNGSPATFNATS